MMQPCSRKNTSSSVSVCCSGGVSVPVLVNRAALSWSGSYFQCDGAGWKLGWFTERSTGPVEGCRAVRVDARRRWAAMEAVSL